MHLGGGIRGKAWYWLKFTKSARTKGTMISLSTRTRYYRATPVFDYESMSEQIDVAQLAALMITGLYMILEKRGQCFNPSAWGRGEDTSTFTPYQDIEAQGATVGWRWNFGTTFRRWETVLSLATTDPRHRASFNQEGPADLMSFNAFFYFCTEFELFPKHAPGSPAVHGGSWSKMEILRDSKVQTAEWFELKQSSTL